MTWLGKTQHLPPPSSSWTFARGHRPGETCEQLVMVTKGHKGLTKSWATGPSMLLQLSAHCCGNSTALAFLNFPSDPLVLCVPLSDWASHSASIPRFSCREQRTQSWVIQSHLDVIKTSQNAMGEAIGIACQPPGEGTGGR
jgi:hypothetical protein